MQATRHSNDAIALNVSRVFENHFDDSIVILHSFEIQLLNVPVSKWATIDLNTEWYFRWEKLAVFL